MFSFKQLINQKGRPLVMGILNVTPDSFSDGGMFFSVETAVERAKELEFSGADIIDIGACSTSPFSVVADETEELRRLERVLPEIARSVKVPLSIDTFREGVASFAFENGVSVFNDESGEASAEKFELVKRYGGGYVFMHTGGGVSSSECIYENGVISAVAEEFKKVSSLAGEAGFSNECIAYDCGIGFGKSRNDDLCLIRDLKKLSDIGVLLVGVSRKRVIGAATGKKDPADRLFGTIAAETAACLNGASVIRTHDAAAALDAVKTARAITGGLENGKDIN